MPVARAASRHSAEAGEQRLAAGHVLGVELLGQVVGAHDQHGEALGGGRDLLGVEHGDRRLDHGPDRRCGPARRRPRGPSRWRRRRRPSRPWAPPPRPGRPRRRPRRSSACHCGVEAVDPDGELAVAVLARGDGGADPVAGLGLGVGGDGVLEVEDDGVGGEALGLLERPLVGARHVEHRAAGPEGRRRVTSVSLRSGEAVGLGQLGVAVGELRRPGRRSPGTASPRRRPPSSR